MTRPLAVVAMVLLAGCQGSPDGSEVGTSESRVKSGAKRCYLDFDLDGRGAGTSMAHADCSDEGWSANDNDCDDRDDTRWHLLECYPDADRDGHGTGAAAQVCSGAACPAGWAEVDDDCDDS